MATVSLRELNRHVGDARQLVDAALNSSQSEPTLNFNALRMSLRSALVCLGGDSANVTADSVRGMGLPHSSGGGSRQRVRADEIFSDLPAPGSVRMRNRGRDSDE